MARMRTIKPDACSSETLTAVDRSVRWTFGCLWTHCDDEGRAVNNHRLIKAAIYPLDDDVTLDVLATELAALEAVGALCMYEVGGKKYLHVPSWAQHQHPNRKVASNLPPCPKEDHSPPTQAQLTDIAVSQQGDVTPVVVVVVGDGEVDGEGVVAAPTATAQKRGTRLPEDWRPSPADRDWTLELIDERTAAVELEKFRNHWISKTGRDATKLEWGRTWRNWVLNCHQQRRGSPFGSTADQRVTEGLTLAAQLRQEQNHAKELSA